jgi:hypothetical protein
VRAGARAHAPGLRRALLLAFPLGCALAALAIGQDANYDLLNYHYYIAYAFLHDRLGVDVYAAQLQSLINPLLDVPIYLLIGHSPPRLEAAVVGAVQGCGPLLVVLVAHRLTRSWVVGFASGVAAAVAGGFAAQIGNSMGDTIVAVPLVGAVLLALQAVDTRGAPGELWRWALAGALAGAGAGLKLSELPVAVGIVVGLVAVGGSLRDRAKRLGAGAAGGVAGVAATSGYWSWFLWVHYRDPIAFTQASFGIFHSPYVPKPRLAGGGYGPRSVLAGLSFPLRWVAHPLLVGEIRFRELSLPLAYTLACFLVLAGAARLLWRAVGRRAGAASPLDDARVVAAGTSTTRDADADRYLIVTFAVSLAIWMKVFSIYRYVLPLEVLSPVVIVAVLRRLAALAPATSPWRARAASGLVPTVLVVCALCAATAWPGNYWLRVPFGSRYFSLQLPHVLDNDKTDAVVEVGGQPMGFLFPQLPQRLVAIGGIGNLLTPANRVLVHRALARVRRDGGDIDVVFVDVPPRHGLSTPKGTSRYLARLGAPGLVARACDVEAAHIGAGFEPVTFCRFGPR